MSFYSVNRGDRGDIVQPVFSSSECTVCITKLNHATRLWRLTWLMSGRPGGFICERVCLYIYYIRLFKECLSKRKHFITLTMKTESHNSCHLSILTVHRIDELSGGRERMISQIHLQCHWSPYILIVIYYYYYWATMFGWPRKSKSTSGSRSNLRYWWLCHMDFRNFISIYVFDVKLFVADNPT